MHQEETATAPAAEAAVFQAIPILHAVVDLIGLVLRDCVCV